MYSLCDKDLGILKYLVLENSNIGVLEKVSQTAACRPGCQQPRLGTRCREDTGKTHDKAQSTRQRRD